MSNVLHVIHNLIDHGNCAQAHFQIWWALRNCALPEYSETMNDPDVRLFFHASNSGHYKLIFIELGKIFDRDQRASGIPSLKLMLRAEGKAGLADRIESQLAPLSEKVRRLVTIRARAIAHIEHSSTPKKIYEENGISPDEIREVMKEVVGAINEVADLVGCSNRITVEREFEESTLSLLAKLSAGKAY